MLRLNSRKGEKKRLEDKENGAGDRPTAEGKGLLIGTVGAARRPSRGRRKRKQSNGGGRENAPSGMNAVKDFFAKKSATRAEV